MEQKYWRTERYWEKFHKVLSDYDCNWCITGDWVEIQFTLESGVKYGFSVPLENFPYEVKCYAEDFDEEEYAAETSFMYDDDVDLDSLIAEGNDIKNFLDWLAFDLEEANKV